MSDHDSYSDFAFSPIGPINENVLLNEMNPDTPRAKCFTAGSQSDEADFETEDLYVHCRNWDLL